MPHSHMQRLKETTQQRSFILNESCVTSGEKTDFMLIRSDLVQQRPMRVKTVEGR